MHRRREMLIGALLIGLILSSCGSSSGQRLDFTTIEQGDAELRADDMPKQAVIYVIASIEDIDFFAQNVLRVEPTTNNQRNRAVDHLRQLDYATTFAILVIRE